MPGSWKGNSHQKCPQSQEIKEINFKEIWRHILVILIDNILLPEMPSKSRIQINKFQRDIETYSSHTPYSSGP
jgi:hypothetical protein